MESRYAPETSYIYIKVWARWVLFRSPSPDVDRIATAGINAGSGVRGRGIYCAVDAQHVGPQSHQPLIIRSLRAFALRRAILALSASYSLFQRINKMLSLDERNRNAG